MFDLARNLLALFGAFCAAVVGIAVGCAWAVSKREHNLDVPREPSRREVAEFRRGMDAWERGDQS